MKSVNEITEKLNAIRQTRRVTNAMYLLSASHAKKGLAQISYNDLYMRRISAAVKDILLKSPQVHNAFIEDSKKSDTAYFLILGGNRGLCGGYNADIVNHSVKLMQDYGKRKVHISGAIAEEMLKAKGFQVDKSWQGATQFPSIHSAEMIAQDIINLFTTGQICQAYVVFTDYINAAKQVVTTRRILPLAADNLRDIAVEYEYESDIIYEPSVEEVFMSLTREYMVGYIYGCLCNALVSENYIRMTAMQNATNNADEMIKKLDTEYNCARQLAITNELTEIAAATVLSNNAI